MSSTGSSSNNVPPPPAPEGRPRSSVGLVAVSLILLAALVWAMAPGRARFAPAPLRQLPAGCPQNTPDFTPSDATEIPGFDLTSLSAAQRNHAIFRLNMEPCPCGCNASLAACRISHPACPQGKASVEKLVAEESGAKSQPSEVEKQK
jgi:hypothetical protein